MGHRKHSSPLLKVWQVCNVFIHPQMAKRCWQFTPFLVSNGYHPIQFLLQYVPRGPLGQVHTKLTKTNRNRTETKQKQHKNKTETNIHTHTHTHMTKRRLLADVSVFCSVHIQRTAAVTLIHHVAHGCGWLYIPRIKNIKRKNQRRFWVRLTLSKRKIRTYMSLPYTTFQLLNACQQHTALRPICRGNCNKTETFWSLPTCYGTLQRYKKHKQLAKMFHNSWRIVADLS